MVRRDPETTRGERQNVGCEDVIAPQTDGDERKERVHEYTLVPAEVAGNETQSDAEVQASRRRNSRDYEGGMSVVQLRLHRTPVRNEATRVLSVNAISPSHVERKQD